MRDLDSRNGTRVHGQPIKTAVLLGGDVFAIGKTTIKLVLPVDEFAVDDEVPLDEMIEEEDQPSSRPSHCSSIPTPASTSRR